MLNVDAVSMQKPDIINALSIVLSPSSNSLRRSQANQYLETVKIDRHNARLGLDLANIQNTDEIRHYGLSLIESNIKLNFADYSAQEIEAIKELAVSLPIKDIGEEKGFIKEKLVSILVELAKRLWPLNWIEFNGVLRSFYDQDVRVLH